MVILGKFWIIGANAGKLGGIQLRRQDKHFSKTTL
jgi:hypothetical protein